MNDRQWSFHVLVLGRTEGWGRSIFRILQTLNVSDTERVVISSNHCATPYACRLRLAEMKVSMVYLDRNPSWRIEDLHLTLEALAECMQENPGQPALYLPRNDIWTGHLSGIFTGKYGIRVSQHDPLEFFQARISTDRTSCLRLVSSQEDIKEGRYP